MSETAKELDQFYTNSKIAQECFDVLNETLKNVPGYNKKGIQYIEPSAGTGAFFNLLPTGTIRGINGNDVSKRLGYDLEPKADEIVECDFLQTDINDDDMVNYNQRVIIGNPPFGKKATLAIDFFNRASDWAPVIAFIIPVQFRKWSVQSKLQQEYSLVVDNNLPNDAFIFHGEPYHVNCCFQVWVKKQTPYENLRILSKPETSHADFEMWQYNNTVQAEKVFNNDFDFAVLRQGYGDYTNLISEARDCNRRKQWILFKASNALVLKRLKRMDFALLSKLNTTTPGFGKADVVNAYNDIYGP